MAGKLPAPDQPQAPVTLDPSPVLRRGDGGSSIEDQVLLQAPEALKRPWSSQGIKSSLSPSPTLVDTRRSSKDDHDISTTSTPLRKRHALSSNLSLKMPPMDTSNACTTDFGRWVPLSPKPECPPAYSHSASVLPRHSRGLDFSRAATNLHHSTLADQPSPDSSPRVGSRRGITTHGRKSFFGFTDHFNGVQESPKTIPAPLWTNFSALDKNGFSSSISSSVVADDSQSDSADDPMDMGEDEESGLFPASGNLSLINPFAAGNPTLANEAADMSNPTTAKLLSYQRARVQSRRERTRGSSSDASRRSTMQSPVPLSPPLIRSLDSSLSATGTYFMDEPTRREIKSRRESLSLGTRDLQLSDAEQSGDEGHAHVAAGDEIPNLAPVTPTMEDRKQVVRRAVTRRSNLMPQSKGFARIRAALLEEGAPLDTELRREAEVVRQVKDNENDQGLNLQPSQPTTNVSSPAPGLATSAPSDPLESSSGDISTSSDESFHRFPNNNLSHPSAKRSHVPAARNRLDERLRTPPPPIYRRESAGLGDEVAMDTQSNASMTPQQHGVQKGYSVDSTTSTPQAGTSATFEVPRKGKKRMRDDDFDPSYFKRRAVSPGMSVQNSPVLPQSPGWWGTPKRDERVSSNGSNGAGHGASSKRVGMQGMNDTNDGLMNMSIE